MSPHMLQLHTGDIDPNCHCEQCAELSPSKKARRGLPGSIFIESPTENQPIVKGNNRYGAKGTIRCLACQRRKGKCEFPADKPDLPCEHCKRRGLRCGDKLPTERKRQLNQQDEHPYIRTMDTTWNNHPQSQYRYTEERQQYPYPNGAPRPVAPALPAINHPSVTYVPRPYHPMPPTIQRPPPTPLFPLGADLVRLIESQIAKISLTETFAVARCLGNEHGLVGNPYISNVSISRKNQEFSRGDSWFNVSWYEIGEQGTIPRSVNLRFEPGRQLCTSYSADDHTTHAPQVQLPQQQTAQPVIAPREREVARAMEVDSSGEPPKMMDWSGLVGELFDKAAGVIDDQGRVKSESETSGSPSARSITPEQTSTALWPLKAWNAVKTIIYGHQLSKSEFVYTIGIPHATVGVVVERCKSIVDVFWSSEETKSTECPQQFIIDSAIKKKVSLKTLAKVLSQLSKLKAKKPQSAGESISMVESLVAESAVDITEPVNGRKRRFEDISDDPVVKVKTERSLSNGSNHSSTTNGSEMKVDTNTVDEETSNAASILNGVSMDRRPIDILPSPMQQPYPYWQQGDIRKNIPSQPSYHANNPPWLYNNNFASQETYR